MATVTCPARDQPSCVIGPDALEVVVGYEQRIWAARHDVVRDADVLCCNPLLIRGDSLPKIQLHVNFTQPTCLRLSAPSSSKCSAYSTSTRHRLLGRTITYSKDQEKIEAERETLHN